MRRTKETQDLLVSLKFYIFNNNDWCLETDWLKPWLVLGMRGKRSHVLILSSLLQSEGAGKALHPASV